MTPAGWVCPRCAHPIGDIAGDGRLSLPMTWRRDGTGVWVKPAHKGKNRLPPLFPGRGRWVRTRQHPAPGDTIICPSCHSRLGIPA